MPFSYHAGHGHLEQCHGCVYSYGRWFTPCDENYVRNGCCLCTPQCPDGMPMAVWPDPDLNDYVCLIPAHEHDDESLKEIEIEKQKKEDKPADKKAPADQDKKEVKPAKKDKKDVKGLDLKPKTPKQPTDDQEQKP